MHLPRFALALWWRLTCPNMGGMRKCVLFSSVRWVSVHGMEYAIWPMGYGKWRKAGGVGHARRQLEETLLMSSSLPQSITWRRERPGKSCGWCTLPSEDLLLWSILCKLQHFINLTGSSDGNLFTEFRLCWRICPSWLNLTLARLDIEWNNRYIFGLSADKSAWFWAPNQ